MNYIFDLDGTLINSSERMYKLFCKLVPDCNLSKWEYWDYKRDKINHEMLLKNLYADYSFEEFNSIWMKEIETEYYLEMDNNYPDTIDVLTELKNNGKSMYLLTARQSRSGLMNELSRLGLLDYFDRVMITEGARSKEDALLDYASENEDIMSKDNYFVGDTGKDIQIGKKYGYKTIGITHGFMSRQRLEEYHPTMLIDELSELLILN